VRSAGVALCYFVGFLPEPMRNIRSPIVVFCSKGDNITPPQQALDWISLISMKTWTKSGRLARPSSTPSTRPSAILASSSRAASPRTNEFSSKIDLIDLLPPGLYETTFERKSADTANPDLTSGEWVMRCEQRTLDDIRAMGGNSPEDERPYRQARPHGPCEVSSQGEFASFVVWGGCISPATLATRDGSGESVVMDA
jgi:hypothetical protein